MNKLTTILTTILTALVLLVSDHATAAEPLDGASPFFAKTIEITPGGTLLLKPRIVPVAGLEDGYTLILNLPAGVTPSEIQTCWVDTGMGRISAIKEGVREATLDGQRRVEFFYVPDLQQAGRGVQLNFLYRIGKEYRYTGIQTFSRSFDWTPFEVEVVVPYGVEGLIPLLVNWRSYWRKDGADTFDAVHLKDLKIVEASSGKTILSKDTVTLRGQAGGADYEVKYFSEEVKITAGAKYRITFLAKGENIESGAKSVADSLEERMFFSRELSFDVSPAVGCPGRLLWRIEDDQKKVYRSGEVALVAAGETVAPRILDAAVWVAESRLKMEPPVIQKRYLTHIRSWGMNTVEPEVDEPEYGTPLTEDNLSVPIARAAKEMGLRVRGYMHYHFSKAEPYLKAHPEYASVTAQKKKGGPWAVCPTHLLDGGKYDSPPSAMRGGRDNPWLGHYYDVIKRSVEVNRLDGVFFDYELETAPHYEVRTNKGLQRRWTGACVCERCRRAFQDYARLSHLPTVEEICEQQHYYDKWVDFRCWQHTRAWKLCAEAAREANPFSEFGIYSGQGKPAMWKYGVDWERVNNATFATFAMWRAHAGETHAVNQMASQQYGFTKGVKHRTQYTLVAATTLKKEVYAAFVNAKNEIVRLVAGGSFGWSTMGFEIYDDQFGRPFREANSLLARYEAFFCDGKRVETLVKVTGGKAASATWQNDKKVITFVFNDTPSAMDVAVERTDQEEQARLRIEPHDCVVQEWKTAASILSPEL